MTVLRFGSKGSEVREWRALLRERGYDLADADVFDGLVQDCTRAAQEDLGLTVDGTVVCRGGQTWPAVAELPETPVCRDTSPRAVRLSDGLKELYSIGQDRMIPEYRQSRLDAWECVEAGTDEAFVVPVSSDGSGCHGATCGHAAWLLTSWWMRAMHPDKGIFPTWRTGRGPTTGMPLRMLPLAPVAGVMYGGARHRGLAEYVACKVRVKELAQLVVHTGPLSQWYFCQRDSGHVVTVLRLGATGNCIDPRTGLAAAPGLYRLAADGSKATIGRPWTWRRVRKAETGPWTCYGMQLIPTSGEIESGPLAGAPDLPLVLE